MIFISFLQIDFGELRVVFGLKIKSRGHVIQTFELDVKLYPNDTYTPLPRQNTTTFEGPAAADQVLELSFDWPVLARSAKLRVLQTSTQYATAELDFKSCAFGICGMQNCSNHGSCDETEVDPDCRCALGRLGQNCSISGTFKHPFCSSMHLEIVSNNFCSACSFFQRRTARRLRPTILVSGSNRSFCCTKRHRLCANRKMQPLRS